MKINSRLLLIAVLCALALPLVFIIGTASAKYMPDGAAQNGTTGLLVAPTDGVCVLGLHADGTMDIDASIHTARDCEARLVTVTAVTTNDTLANVCGITTKNTAGVKYAAPGSKTCVTIDGSGYITGSTSMVNLDRGAVMCNTLGGQLANATPTTLSNGAVISTATKTVANGTAAKCIAYGWLYAGQDANGTPLTFGAKGVTQGTGTGYCYTTMNMTTAYGTATACPSNQAAVAPFNTNAAYDWAFSSSKCTYAKGIAGYINGALTKTDGTTTAAGTYVDLSTKATQGECLAFGGSWANWTGQAASTSSIATTPLASTIPAWDYTINTPDADSGCLHCHSTKSQANGPAERQKDSYLLTGHRNMLRKVTAGKKWAGPDGVTYDVTGSAYGQVGNVGGSINFGTLGNNDATANGKPLLYVFGDWMAAAPAGLDVVVSMSGLAKYNGSSNYSCSACHTTGWRNSGPGTCSDGTATTLGSLTQSACEAAGKVWTDAGLCSLSSKKSQSACTTAGGTWYPTIGVEGIGDSSYVAKEPLASFPGITFQGAGQWDSDGIMCGRCHNAQVGPITSAAIAASQYPATAPTSGGMGALAAGVKRNSLCFGCHQSMAATANGTGTDVDLNNPTGLIVKNTATAPAYVPGFSGHVLGNSFLNSPHARFTGTVVPNALGKYDLATNTSANYNSTFRGYTCWQSNSSNSPAKTKADGTEIKTKAECEGLYGAGAWRADTNVPTDGPDSIQGTCTTCHDVHNSLFVAGQEGLRKECQTCHVDNAPDYALTAKTTINHPTTAGTPAAVDTDSPCVVCHMPQPTSGDFPMHVFRINADASYSTFPTAAQFNGNTRKNATTATDSKGYTNAVWVDVDLACGQCHTNASNTLAPQLTKTQLAQAAVTMHNTDASTSNCVTCHTTKTVPNHGPSTNNDIVPTTCTSCHKTPLHQGVTPTVLTTCGNCHGSSGPSFNFTSTQLNAIAQPTMHGMVQSQVTCSACHSESLSTMHSDSNPGTPKGCTACHNAPLHSGAPFNVDTACGLCHGAAACGTGTGKSGAPCLTTGELQSVVNNIHNTFPKAVISATKDSSTSYKMNFTGGFSTCPTGQQCSYSWSFGDGTTETHTASGPGTPDFGGIITSHTYADNTARLVILTVDTSGFTSDSVTATVNPILINKAPVATGLQTYVQSGRTVTFTDASTDSNADALTSYVNWGDGSAMSQGTAGTVFTHTYPLNGGFKITHTVRDPGGLSNKESKSVTISNTSGTTGNVNISSTGALTTKKITYYIKTSAGLTKKSGSINIGSGTGNIALDSDDYKVYLYYPSGAGCSSTYVNGTVFTLGTGTQAIPVTCN